MDTFKGRGVQRDDSRPLPPDEALQRFTVREGFAIDLVAAEPAVSQPLYMSFDSRGRLWVTQYIQYQYPAGLKVTSYDNISAPCSKGPGTAAARCDRRDTITDRRCDCDGTYGSIATSSRENIAGGDQGCGGSGVNPPYLLSIPTRR